ncbi:exosortase/archaeosortase family protein, partial [Candidatus Laterigemmans baculatus]|uniref:exosortase/archaeosortase family protein n=1 Tax=Candidatus Laterigemmans baculatus TaxID=2770505 RepID=UPI0013D95100
MSSWGVDVASAGLGAEKAEARAPLRAAGLWLARSLGSLVSGLSQLLWLAGYALTAALLFPSLVSLAGWTSGREHYAHFQWLLVAAGCLAVFRGYSESQQWIGRGVGGRGVGGRVSLRVLFWTGTALVLAAGVHLLPSRWLAAPAAWCTVAATIAFLGGRPLWRLLFGPLLLLAAAIPLPVNLDQWLIVELQHLATRLASLWLDLAGVLHFTSGVAIQTPGQDFFVEDACSGVHSLFAAIAVGVAYGVLRQYRLPRLIVLVAQLVFWVVVANAVRVFLTVWSQAGIEAGAEAWFGGLLPRGGDAEHAGLGMVTFAAGIGLALCGDAFVRYLIPIRGGALHEYRDSWESDQQPAGWFDASLPAWSLVVPGVVGIAAVVALSGVPAPAVAAGQKVWDRVAVPRPEGGWGTPAEVFRHAVGYWGHGKTRKGTEGEIGSREPVAGGRGEENGGATEVTEGTEGDGGGHGRTRKGTEGEEVAGFREQVAGGEEEGGATGGTETTEGDGGGHGRTRKGTEGEIGSRGPVAGGRG